MFFESKFEADIISSIKEYENNDDKNYDNMPEDLIHMYAAVDWIRRWKWIWDDILLTKYVSRQVVFKLRNISNIKYLSYTDLSTELKELLDEIVKSSNSLYIDLITNENMWQSRLMLSDTGLIRVIEMTACFKGLC